MNSAEQTPKNTISGRRATSAPMATWISVPRTTFRFTAGKPAYFASSPGVRRGFCARCGSPLTYENERVPDEILRDDPAQRPAHPPRAPEIAALDHLSLSLSICIALPK